MPRRVVKCCFNCAYGKKMEDFERASEEFNKEFRICGAVKIDQYFPMYQERNNCHRFDKQPKDERDGVPYHTVIFRRGGKKKSDSADKKAKKTPTKSGTKKK